MTPRDGNKPNLSILCFWSEHPPPPTQPKCVEKLRDTMHDHAQENKRFWKNILLQNNTS